jgi:hypothetical protein
MKIWLRYEEGMMGTKHHKPEEIVAKLRQVEVLSGQVSLWPRRFERLG